jgi:hypothetical protein
MKDKYPLKNNVRVRKYSTVAYNITKQDISKLSKIEVKNEEDIPKILANFKGNYIGWDKDSKVLDEAKLLQPTYYGKTKRDFLHRLVEHIKFGEIKITHISLLYIDDEGEIDDLERWGIKTYNPRDNGTLATYELNVEKAKDFIKRTSIGYVWEQDIKDWSKDHIAYTLNHSGKFVLNNLLNKQESWRISPKSGQSGDWFVLTKLAKPIKKIPLPVGESNNIHITNEKEYEDAVILVNSSRERIIKFYS